MKLRAVLGTVTSFAMVGLLAVACANSDDSSGDDDGTGGDSGPVSIKSDSGSSGSSGSDSGGNKPTDSGTKADTGGSILDTNDDVNTGTAPDCDPNNLSIAQIGAILGGSPGPCDSTCNAATSCCLDLTALFSGGGGLPIDAGVSAGGLCLPNM